MYIIQVKNKSGKKAYVMATRTDKLILGDKMSPDTRIFQTRELATAYAQSQKKFLAMAKEINILSVAEMATNPNNIFRPEENLYIVIQENIISSKKSFVGFDDILKHYFPAERKDSAVRFFKNDGETVCGILNSKNDGCKYYLEEVPFTM